LKLETFLPYRLAVLSSVVSLLFSQIHASHNLGTSEWLVLMSLGESGQMAAKTLGAKTRMHKTKVSRAVAALLAREFISRQPNRTDRREAFLCLTPAGKIVYDQCVSSADMIAKRLEQSLSAEDRLAMDRALDEIAAQSDRIAAEMLHKRHPA
jgi:DNA-binding MarR family transcriptional regulator